MTIYGNTNAPSRPILLAVKGLAVTLTMDYGVECDKEEIPCVIEDVGEEKVYLYTRSDGGGKLMKLRIECVSEVKIRLRVQ